MDKNERRAGAPLLIVVIVFAIAAVPAWIVSDKMLGPSSNDVGLSRAAGILFAVVIGAVAAGLTAFFMRRGDATASRRVVTVAGIVLLVYIVLVALAMSGTDHSLGRG